MFADNVNQLELLKLIFENDPDLIFVKDAHGNFLAVNDALAKSYGLKLNEVLNVNNGHINKNADELAKFRADDAEVLRTGVTKFFEETVTNSKGEVSYFLTRKIPLKNSHDELLVLGISQDITQIKKQQIDLTRHESMLDICFMESPIAMGSASMDGYFLTANKAFQKLLGYTKAELSRLTIADITDRTYRDDNLEQLEKLKRQEFTQFAYNKNLLHKNGTPIPVRVTTKFSPPGLISAVGFFFATIEDLRVDRSQNFTKEMASNSR